MISEKEKYIEIDSYKYEVIIKKKKMKRVLIRISSLLQIIIHCPINCSYDMAFNFMTKNINWIKKTIEKQRIIYNEMKIYDCHIYKKIWLKGSLFTFKETDNTTNYFNIVNNEIYIPKSFSINEKVVEKIREKFYPYIFEKFKKIELIFSNYINIKPKITLKHLKTKWGICNYTTGEIVINKKLIHVKEELLEYVIIHEFTHFLFPNHSKEFYKALKEFCLNYKYYENELKKYNFLLK